MGKPSAGAAVAAALAAGVAAALAAALAAVVAREASMGLGLQVWQRLCWQEKGEDPFTRIHDSI